MATCSQNPVVTIMNLLISDAVITRRQVPEKRKKPQRLKDKLGKKSKQISDK